MYLGIKAVQPLPEFRLLLTFENGEQRVFDLTPYLDTGVFKALRDENTFKDVRISFDTVEWPNGADLCPETLYTESLPLEESQAAAME
ncbi:MAG TPA: DUF2442 domain-containing protein [Candidatus Hydrogenedentes bacterium]|nr:DUF2442 domain-containing protein [Candidatus Hydrogenedentota bacterium]